MQTSLQGWTGVSTLEALKAVNWLAGATDEVFDCEFPKYCLMVDLDSESADV